MNRFSGMEDNALWDLFYIDEQDHRLDAPTRAELDQELALRQQRSAQAAQPTQPAAPAVPGVGSLVSGALGGAGGASVAAPAASSAAPTIIHAGPVGSYAAAAPSTVAGVPLTLGGAGAVAGGAYTGYQQATGLNDFAQGNKLDAQQKVALALPTFGASLVSDQIQDALGFGDSDKFKTEYNRTKALQDKGVKWFGQMAEPKSGRSKEELLNKSVAPDFVGKTEDGTWVNNKFSQSRNVADLKPEDTWGYAAHGELLGNAYQEATGDQRWDYNNRLLQEGLLDEHHGTIDYKDKERAQQIWNEIATQPTSEAASQATKPGDFENRPATGEAIPVSATTDKMPTAQPGALVQNATRSRIAPQDLIVNKLLQKSTQTKQAGEFGGEEFKAKQFGGITPGMLLMNPLLQGR